MAVSQTGHQVLDLLVLLYSMACLIPLGATVNAITTFDAFVKCHLADVVIT